jgi:hypothetical protein
MNLTRRNDKQMRVREESYMIHLNH